MAASRLPAILTLRLSKTLLFCRTVTNKPVRFGGVAPLLSDERKLRKEELPADRHTLEEILQDANATQEGNIELEGVNIGAKFKARRLLKQDVPDVPQDKGTDYRANEVPLERMRELWQEELGPIHKKTVAEHYGIFKDLFLNCHFHPVTNLRVFFDYDEDLVTPVHLGNVIPPSEAATVPHVDYEAEEGSLWTLIMTNPDTHLSDNTAEILHWMVGNIPGNDLARGELLCPYLQPFPPDGTGFHRHIFLLFRQEKVLDFSSEKRPEECFSLSDRTFRTADFYRKFEDDVTPMGLSFFQSLWDKSVTDVFHNKLDMKEPSYEYRHPLPYHPPQRRYPKREPFDRYFDRYRDKKDLGEEVVKMKMELTQPLQPYKPKEKYPIVHLYDPSNTKPSWLKRREELVHRRQEQFKALPK